MAKALDDTVLNAALTDIGTSTVMHLTSAQPANFAGIAAVSLGSIAMVSGDFVQAAGTPSGRKVTVGAKNGLSIGTSGTANHVVIATGTVLKAVTTMTAQAVTAGNTANVAAWAITITQPT